MRGIFFAERVLSLGCLLTEVRVSFQVPNPLVVASLLPIVGGVALASLTEVSFNW